MSHNADQDNGPGSLAETGQGATGVVGFLSGVKETVGGGSQLGAAAPAASEVSAGETGGPAWYASAAEEERLVSETRALALAAGDARAAQADAFWVLACVRARKGSAPLAAARLRALVAWRAALGAEEAAVRAQSRAFLARGVIVCSGARDRAGRYVLNGRLRYTDPAQFSALDVVRALALVIEWCLRTYPAAQNTGLVFCTDFGGAGLHNIDVRVPGEMSHAFGKTLPVRVAGMFALNLPWFIRPVFAVVSAILSRKIKGRVRGIARPEELAQYFDPGSVLKDAEMGGTLVWDEETHAAWVERVLTDSESWPPVSSVPSKVSGTEE